MSGLNPFTVLLVLEMLSVKQTGVDPEDPYTNHFG